MKFLNALALLVFIIFSHSAIAGGQNGPLKVSSLRVGDDGVYIQFNPAPSACNGGNQYRMHARVRHSISKNYDALVSSLLTAYTTGQSLNYIWFNDLPSGVEACSNNGGELLELTMIEFSAK